MPKVTNRMKRGITIGRETIEPGKSADIETITPALVFMEKGGAIEIAKPASKAKKTEAKDAADDADK